MKDRYKWAIVGAILMLLLQFARVGAALDIFKIFGALLGGGLFAYVIARLTGR